MSIAENFKIFSIIECQQLFALEPIGSFFYASDGNEPIHIHVLSDDKMVKFWIKPVRLAVNNGFSPKDLREIQQLVTQNQELIERKWNEFFSHS